ncbi:neuropeptide S receptor-like [Centruroides vittatus]|uniref:neuropeptide S receptor-like n=1 Tax=Centruroides vittatus TaxID=120091 RepID=UPI00350FF837
MEIKTGNFLNSTRNITQQEEDILNTSISIATENYSKIYPDAAVWNAELIQRVVTLGVVMTLTLIGNTIIVLVLSRSRYRKRSSRVNIFILNLALGDLAVCCITMTSELLFDVFGEWVLGGAACKIIVYAQIVTLASTTFILTTMSYDRYQAICRPLTSAGGIRQAKIMIAVSWMLAFILAIPQLFIFVQVEAGITESGRVRYECVSQGYTAIWQRKLYFTWLTTYILIIPTFCISYCYVNVLRAIWEAGRGSQTMSLRRSINAASTIPRAKIKTLKLTICIIASFVICWTPYFVVHNIRIYSNYSIKVPKKIIIAAETLALFNSALNPIFYGYFNVRVRKGFMEIIYRKKDFKSCISSQSYSGHGNSIETRCSNGPSMPQNENITLQNRPPIETVVCTCEEKDHFATTCL